MIKKQVLNIAAVFICNIFSFNILVIYRKINFYALNKMNKHFKKI